MSRCPGPHLLSCGVCGGTDAGLRARAEAAERERDRLRGAAAYHMRERKALAEQRDAALAELERRLDPGEYEAIYRQIATPRAALAGEGEACASAKERLPGECCRCYQTSDLPSCSDGREHCQHHSGGEAAEAQPTCTRCRMEPACEELRICLGCSQVPGVMTPEDPDPVEAPMRDRVRRCTWTYDETHCAWDSSCGEKWILEDGGPNENRIRFCHGCSKPVEVACEATPEKARQA